MTQARRAVSLSAVRAALAGLSRQQQIQGSATRDTEWTTARLLAANIVVLSALTAVVLVVAEVLTDVTRQAYFVIFVLLTVFLLCRGRRLRRRGLELLGRSHAAQLCR